MATVAPNPEARVTIVIPVYDKLEYTRPCLESLAATLPPGLAEVVVVDNASTDGTAEWLRDHAPWVRVITNATNVGFARASNMGAAVARTPYVLFLNNDTVAHPGWLEPLVEVVDRDPRVVAVGSRLLFPDGTLQHAGVLVTRDLGTNDPLLARHAHYGKPGDLPDALQARCHQVLTAACLLVRHDAFEAVGGFDEGYWNGYEDVDLCLALHERGGLLVYEPRSVLTHHESKSGPERFSRVTENVARLHERWAHRVEPDATVHVSGHVEWTDACHIRDYTPPPSADDLPAGRVAGLVSVVVLTWNQLPLTRACLASVRRHTHHPLQLIVVDNGSNDGTVEWLRAEAVAHADTTLVENASNLGFAAGCNQGLAQARGEWVVLLNNDTVVTEGWLDGMIAVHGALRNAGFVGPVTNEIAGLQRAVAPDYVRADLDAFAAAWRERHRHQRVPSPRLVGFCLLGHASLWARVGGLDESYATGNYEDDDLCLRAELAGFRNVIAGEVFIHHEGSASFVGNGVDHRATMAANRARFLAKWRAGAEDTAIGRRVLLHEAVERARVLEETGRLQEAIELCLEAVRVSPTESLAYRILAEMLLHAGHAQDALDVLANLPAGPADGTSRVLIACASLAAGDVARALRIADAVNEEGDLRSRALNLRGLVAHAAGDLEQANRCFNAAIAADRGNGLPYSNLGAMLWEREPGDAAFGLFVRALTLSPLSSDALASLCDAAKTLGRVPEARVAVREARGFHPVHRGLAFAAIDLALADGDAAGAMEAIEDALEWFGFDDAFLQAALAVRARVGPRTLGERDGSPDTLSVCLIVRNEEERLVRALRSVLPIADEVVVVDSGSTDRTRELATVLGARVVEHEWTGDFSAARNASLEAAHGAWVLVLDADEAIATSDLPRLRAALREPNGVAGWTLVTRNYGDDASVVGRVANDGSYPRDEAGSGWHPSRKVRLFRNDPRVRFEGALHEVVDDALRRHDLRVAGLDVPVHHYGAFAREREREKAERYLDLARRKLAEAPDDTQALWECAVQAGVAGRHEEAVGLWTRWLRLPDPAREAVAWLNLGRAHLELHAYTEAARATRKALERDPESRDAARNLALCELGRGRTREAKTLAMRLAHEGAEASTWALVAATAVLTRDDDALAIARRGLEGAGAAAATALQAHAVRLRLAGRTNEAARLESAVRDEWRALLAARGLDDSDEAVETLVREGERALGTVAERSAV